MHGDERVGPGFLGRLRSKREGGSRAGDDRDDLIDVAAQTMTRGEPSAQLRMAVRERIERNYAPWSFWGKAATAGAAALLLLVVGRNWSGPHDEAGQARPTAVEQTAVAPPVLPRVEAAGPPPPIATVTRPRRRPVRPLDPIAPLVIEPMTTPLMAVGTSSGLMPIEIDDLRIEPLQTQ